MRQGIGPVFALDRGLRAEPLLGIHAERLLAPGWTSGLGALCGLASALSAGSVDPLTVEIPCREQKWLPFRNQEQAGRLAFDLDDRFQGVKIGPQSLGDFRAVSNSMV